MKAKLIKALRIKGKAVAPKGDDIVIVDLDDDEFKRLSAMGKVVEATEKDLKLAGVEDSDDEAKSNKRTGRKPSGTKKAESTTKDEAGSGADTQAGGNPADDL